ncbi:MAG: DNA/RNA non-specific endonuclease [bacterium]
MSEASKFKRTENFRPDLMIPTGSATPEDYKKSGYDRGHLCPAGRYDIRCDCDVRIVLYVKYEPPDSGIQSRGMEAPRR